LLLHKFQPIISFNSILRNHVWGDCPYNVATLPGMILFSWAVLNYF